MDVAFEGFRKDRSFCPLLASMLEHAHLFTAVSHFSSNSLRKVNKTLLRPPFVSSKPRYNS